MGTLQYLNSDANQQEYREKQIDILNCSNTDSLLNQFPQCCSNAGITMAEEHINCKLNFSYHDNSARVNYSLLY